MCRKLSAAKVILACLIVYCSPSFATKKTVKGRAPSQAEVQTLKECGTAEEVLSDFLLFHTKGEGLSFRKKSCADTGNLKYYIPGESDPGDDVDSIETYTVLTDESPFVIQNVSLNKETGYWIANVVFNVLEGSKVVAKPYKVSFVLYTKDPANYGCIIPNDLPPVGLITASCIEKSLIKNAKRASNWNN